LAARDPDDDNEAAFFADNDFCEVEFAGAVSMTDHHSFISYHHLPLLEVSVVCIIVEQYHV
jgi:hypothetical protein